MIFISKITCPKTLDKEGKKEWKRVLKFYDEGKKGFENIDIKALERYCSCYSDVLKFSKLLDESGYIITSSNGYPQQHPFCQLKRNAEQEMRNWMKELGLTPASRVRMDKNKSSNNDKSDNNYGKEDKEMEELLS
ncbi:MAG: phage terminase small subunit P27 family [Clostridium sp.]|uniref:phage terminase small subunit P27 family n=1 Tax=Clostridium sp. TaxID=1506 RepID=UPI003F2EADD1